MRQVTVLLIVMVVLTACSLQELQDLTKTTLGSGMDALTGAAGSGITVTKTQANISIPYDVDPMYLNPQNFIWNHDNVPDYALEYGWEVLIPKGTEVYSLGFVFWKNGGEKRTTLKQFMASKSRSCAGAYKVETQGGQEQYTRIQVARGGLGEHIVADFDEKVGIINVLVSGEDLIAFLFADRPNQVLIRMTMPNGRSGEFAKKTFESPVKYW